MEVKELIKNSQKQYNMVKKQADKLRLTYLEEKAEAIAKDGKLEGKNVYKQLILRERQREAARNIRYVLNKVNGGGVTRVEVKQPNGSVQELTGKEDIEKACMEENKKKYLQANNTPCLVQPLRQKFEEDNIQQSIKAILDGSFQVPTGSHPMAQEFFNELKRTEIKIPFKHRHITTKNFQEGWKKMKEKTSAGISGLHFSHMKACAMDPFLAEFEASLANIPYYTGFSPPQWEKGVSVMIHKKENVDLVGKLRTVTLLEADFNFNNKVLGKETLHHAEINGLLAKEQYGS